MVLIEVLEKADKLMASSLLLSSKLTLQATLYLDAKRDVRDFRQRRRSIDM